MNIGVTGTLREDRTIRDLDEDSEFGYHEDPPAVAWLTNKTAKKMVNKNFIFKKLECFSLKLSYSTEAFSSFVNGSRARQDFVLLSHKI